MSTESRQPIQVVLVTTDKERAAVVKSWGELRRHLTHPRSGAHLYIHSFSQHGTIAGLPVVVRPNFHVYVACAAMGIPGYEVLTFV